MNENQIRRLKEQGFTTEEAIEQAREEDRNAAMVETDVDIMAVTTAVIEYHRMNGKMSVEVLLEGAIELAKIKLKEVKE